MNPKVIQLARNELDSRNLVEKVKKLLEVCRAWSKTPETIGKWIDLMNINDDEDEIIHFLKCYPQMKSGMDLILKGRFKDLSVINDHFSWFSKNASNISTFNEFILTDEK